MEIVSLADGRKTIYLDVSELEELDDKDSYAHCSVPGISERSYVSKLYEKGFMFAGRSVTLEVPLFRWKNTFRTGERYAFICDGEWDTERVFHVAKNHFANDHRFNPDIRSEHNSELKNYLLKDYIERCRCNNCRGEFCTDSGKDVGFNLWSMQGEEARIVLGAVMPEYSHTGIALYLYAKTLENMLESGVRILREKISVSNMVSFNMHTMIFQKGGVGFKLVDFTDFYLRG